MTADDSAAMIALDQAGMLAHDDDRYAELDMLIMGRPEAAKFEQPGDVISGKIVDIFSQQAKDFDSGALKFWDDGRPVLDPVLVLRTDQGLRTLYVGSYRMRNAIRDAVIAAGFERGETVPGPRRDGTLVIRYTGDGEPARKGGRGPKLYEAAYDPPGRRPLLPAPDAVQPALQSAEPPF